MAADVWSVDTLAILNRERTSLLKLPCPFLCGYGTYFRSQLTLPSVLATFFGENVRKRNVQETKNINMGAHVLRLPQLLGTHSAGTGTKIQNSNGKTKGT